LILWAFVDNDGLAANTEHAYLLAIIFYDDKSETSWSRSWLLDKRSNIHLPVILINDESVGGVSSKYQSMEGS